MRTGFTRIVAVCGLILLFQGPAVAAQLPYTVAPGDSLYKLGQRFGVTAAELISLNGLRSDQIVVGQVLRVPGQSHTVRPGDSLFLLARHYGTTVDALKQANVLRSDQIQAGQVLAIPERSPATSSLIRTDGDMRLLAQMIHAEADGEPYLGMVAVGAVILNRIRSPLFPNTLWEVLFQPRQFEPVMNGWFWRPPGTKALQAAGDAAGGWDPSQGALYFYNPDKSTSRWIVTLPVILRIGNHLFCR
ncbi:MAG: LysM peptidoglycan-binding domain-containing protein [bacterium]|nr:LysM peptidoglycan-binding domain-containing protein [bacterium]